MKERDGGPSIEPYVYLIIIVLFVAFFLFLVWPRLPETKTYEQGVEDGRNWIRDEEKLKQTDYYKGFSDGLEFEARQKGR